MPALHRLARTVAVVLACSGSAGAARAYSTPDAYVERASQGGGGGRWFTGSPADGFGCSVCHSSTAEQPHFPFYVAGLPEAGYTLAGRQEIALSWPEFAARWRELRPDPTVPAAPGTPLPAVSVVLELVAESGRGSGVIEIDTRAAAGGQLCEQTRKNLQPRLGAKLYQVRAGLDPLVLKPDSNGLLRCEARQLGQRCVLALLSCGAQELRFTWTAPPTWEGPIWFSAGFVATETLSGTIDQDSVEEITVPIVQAGTPGAEYEQTLRNGCGVADHWWHGAGASRRRDVGGTGARAFALGAGALALALLARRMRGSSRERG